MGYFLQITKNRFDGQLGSIGLKFDKDSLSFAMKPNKNAALTLDSDSPVTDTSSSHSTQDADDQPNDSGDDPKW